MALKVFNPAAFAQPALGAHGDLERNAAVGPNFWNVDLAISRLVRFGSTRRLELQMASVQRRLKSSTTDIWLGSITIRPVKTAAIHSKRSRLAAVAAG